MNAFREVRKSITEITAEFAALMSESTTTTDIIKAWLREPEAAAVREECERIAKDAYKAPELRISLVAGEIARGINADLTPEGAGLLVKGRIKCDWNQILAELNPPEQAE